MRKQNLSCCHPMLHFIPMIIVAVRGAGVGGGAGVEIGAAATIA